MKIVIDNSPLSSGHSVRGIGTYTRLLINALQTYQPEHEFIFSAQPYSQKADVVHFPYFDFFFLTLPFYKPMPTVVTIHDAIPLVFPKSYPPGIRGRFKHVLQKLSLKSVSHIVTDSLCSTKDVVNILNQPQEKVSTVYLAPDPQYSPASKAIKDDVRDTYDLSKPFLLYVGDINYNKNLVDLFQTFSLTRKDVDLVIVSKALDRNNPAASHLWRVIDHLNIEPRLKILNTILNDGISTMRGLYSLASWYIQPSLYEGFGLPVLEAQACGCPVISSTGGSLAEITDDSVVQFDPHHEKELLHALELGLSMSNDEKSTYINRGFTNLKRFSWEKTSDQMISTYESLV